LGPILFNTFSNDLEEEVAEYTLTKFVDTSKLCAYICMYVCAANIHEDMAAIQRDLNRSVE